MHPEALEFGGRIFYGGRAMRPIRGGESQGAPAAAQPPPAAGSQGGNGTGIQPPAPQPGADGFWGNFPDVPESERATLEPHLKNVQAHVTQLEQRYAPLKNLSPEEVQGLAGLSAAFDQDPRGTWIQMGEALQKSGDLHAELDLEAVANAAMGQFGEDGAPGAPDGSPNLDGLPPELQQYVQGLEGKIDQLSQGFQGWQQQDQQRQARQQQDAENRAFDRLKAQTIQELKGAGIPEEVLTDQKITALFITHRGDANGVKQTITADRDALLKSLGRGGQPSSEELQVQGNLPGASQGSKPKDAFAKASQGAKAFLSKSNESAAQGS